MKDTLFKIISNKQIAKNTYECVMEGDISHVTASGQFVNIKLDGFYLRDSFGGSSHHLVYLSMSYTQLHILSIFIKEVI